jgi:hypothetical protein
MKKEATQKNTKEHIQKTTDEKRGNLEKCKGLIQKTFEEKRGNIKKRKEAHSKDLR